MAEHHGWTTCMVVGSSIQNWTQMEMTEDMFKQSHMRTEKWSPHAARNVTISKIRETGAWGGDSVFWFSEEMFKPQVTEFGCLMLVLGSGSCHSGVGRQPVVGSLRMLMCMWMWMRAAMRAVVMSCKWVFWNESVCPCACVRARARVCVHYIDISFTELVRCEVMLSFQTTLITTLMPPGVI